MRETCVMCEKRINTEEDDYAVGESIGEYWCCACAEKESRLLDAEIAVNLYGWKWETPHGIRKILVPPEDDEKRHWTAIWDENGIPNFLPRYSEMKSE